MAGNKPLLRSAAKTLSENYDLKSPRDPSNEIIQYSGWNSGEDRIPKGYPFDQGFYPVPRRLLNDLRPKLGTTGWGFFQFVWENTVGAKTKPEWIELTPTQFKTSLGISETTVHRTSSKLAAANYIKTRPSQKTYKGYALKEYAINWQAVHRTLNLFFSVNRADFTLPALWYSSAKYYLTNWGCWEAEIVTSDGRRFSLPSSPDEALRHLIRSHQNSSVFSDSDMEGLIRSLRSPEITGSILSGLAHTFMRSTGRYAAGWYRKIIESRVGKAPRRRKVSRTSRESDPEKVYAVIRSGFKGED